MTRHTTGEIPMDSGTPVVRAETLLQRSGYAPRQIQGAGQGGHHHLFVVELDDGPLRVLRLPRAEMQSQAGHILRGEAEAICRAREFLPVPYPVELLPTSEQPEACLMPILEGIRASDLREGHDLAPVARRLGRCLAALHKIRCTENEPSSILHLFPDLPSATLSLLHGDAHLGNLLVSRQPRKGWQVSGFIDWSFCRWGPPEADLVEMAICEAEPRPVLGRVFYEAYLEAGGLPPREPLFRRSLMRELERRLQHHQQSHEARVRDTWTRWLDALRRPAVSATRIFDAGREPGRGLC